MVVSQGDDEDMRTVMKMDFAIWPAGIANNEETWKSVVTCVHGSTVA